MEEEKTTLELVEQARDNNKIAFMTIDGLMSTTVDEILNQHIEGILYDLNRDYATIVTLAKNSKNLRWVNDLALSDLFKEVFNRYKKLEEENKLLRNQLDNITKLEETDSKIEKKIHNIETIKPAQQKKSQYKEGFDTDMVFVI